MKQNQFSASTFGIFISFFLICTVFTMKAQVRPPSAKIDLRMEVKNFPRQLTAGKRTSSNVEVEITYYGHKSIEISCDLVISTGSDYPVPAPFAVAGDAYKSGMLLKGGREFVSIAPEQDKPATAQVNLWGELPADIPSGRYYLIAVIDAGNRVTEINEKNNYTALPVIVSNPADAPAWGSHGSRDESNLVLNMNRLNVSEGVDIAHVGEEGRGLYQLYYRYKPDAASDAEATTQWTWKAFGSVEETFDFLNTDLTYDPDKIEIVARDGAEGVRYLVFYQVKARKKAISWGWKRATSTEDALNFINGQAPYFSLSRAVLTGVKKGNQFDIIIFYQKGASNAEKKWYYTEVVNSKKGLIFINGENPQRQPAKYIKVFASVRGGEEVFHIFYGF